MMKNSTAYRRNCLYFESGRSAGRIGSRRKASTRSTWRSRSLAFSVRGIEGVIDGEVVVAEMLSTRGAGEFRDEVEVGEERRKLRWSVVLCTRTIANAFAV